jgi:hypothetical protein
MVATHDVVPFTLGVLAIAAAVEVSAFADHWLSERWIVAAAANLCALLMTWLVTRAGGPPESYAPISTEAALGSLAALLVVYAGGTVARTLVRGLDITVFETAQTVLAFVISLSGALRVAAGRPAAEAVVGGLAMVGGAACYLVSFLLLERKEAAARNLHTYSTFALLLATAGSRLLLDGSPLGLWWCVLALAAVWIGARSGRDTLLLHGAFYLVAASIASGAAAAAASRLLGTPDAAGPPGLGLVIVVAAAMLATWSLVRSGSAGSRRVRWLPLVAIAALFAWTAAALASWALLSAWAWLGGSAGFAATLSTIVLSGLSAALAWAGRRCRCTELVWLVPPFLVLTGYKLLTQDLRQAQTLALFVSLLSYGAVLILLPRLLQQKAAGEPARD